MKTYRISLIVFAFFLCPAGQYSYGQLTKTIGRKLETKANNEANRAIDEALDKKDASVEEAAAANRGYGAYKFRNKSGIKEGTFPVEAFMDKGTGRLAKISIWRQNKRVRVYVNENKILDLPSILPDGLTLNTFAWSTYSYYNEDKYFIGNIRVAAGLPDNRQNLMQNGKYVTTGILFDVKSDVIKPESYGTLKEIANVLKANPGTKITIVGHTDSSTLTTDGKGETEPFANNDTPQNKANNRRVEFIVTQN